MSKKIPVGAKRRSTIKPEELAEKIGVPVQAWPGKCHEIAGLMLVAEWAEGTLRYGTWLGPIDKSSPQFGGKLLVHHGWIEVQAAKRCECGSLFQVQGPCCDKNGAKPAKIIDPTRWVFENVKPYIFDGSDVESHYDVAGDRFRAMLMKPYPSQRQGWEPETTDKDVVIESDGKTIRRLAVLIHQHGGPALGLNTHKNLADGSETKSFVVPIRGACWLANLPLAHLGDHAKPFYEALDKINMGAFVPQDNREVTMGDGFYGTREHIKKLIEKRKS